MKSKFSRKAISKSARFRVFARDGFRCQYCGLSAPDVELQVDHVEPVAKGGAHHESNFITACSHCNAGKRDMSGISQLIARNVEAEFWDQYEDLWREHSDDILGDPLPWFMLPKYTRPLRLDFDVFAAARELAPAAPLPAVEVGTWEGF